MSGGYRVLTHRPLMVEVEASISLSGRLDVDYFRPDLVAAANLVSSCGIPGRTLGEICRPDRPITDGIRRHDKAEAGVHLIRTQNLVGPWIDYGSCVFIPEEWHRTSLKSETQPGDLLVAIRGYLGAAALVPEGAPRANINQHIARIAVDDSMSDPAYAWAFVSCSYGKKIFERNVTGTVERGITLPDLREISIPMPSRRIQDHIGAKVRLATKHRLEAETLMREAFQMLSSAFGSGLDADDFEVHDPTEAWEDGYRVIDVRPVSMVVDSRQIRDQIAAQYFHPRRARALRKIEEARFPVKPLCDIAGNQQSRVSRDAVRETGLPYVGLADIDSTTGYVNADTYCDKMKAPATKFVAQDILFSRLRPYLNKVAICPEHVAEASGSTELVVYRVAPPIDPYYVLCILRSPLVYYQVVDLTSGSTLPRLDESDIGNIAVPMLPVDAQTAIASATRGSLQLLHKSTLLAREAIADVEALIEGRLDLDAIVAGRVQVPPSEEVLGA